MCVYTVNHCYPLDVRDFCLAQFFYHHHYFQKLEIRNKTDNPFFKYKKYLLCLEFMFSVTKMHSLPRRDLLCV